MKSVLSGVFMAGLMVTPLRSFAACADGKHYFCVPIVFQTADPKLKNAGAFPKHCSGMAVIKGAPVGVVFQDEGACPRDNTAIVVHVTSICQDVKPWTRAVYWVSARPAFCLMSHEQRRDQAKKLAALIHPGMTRTQVRAVLKEYEYIGGGFSADFSSQFYGHPDVMIEVPFDAPPKDAMSESKVNGRATISDVDMPKP